MLHTKYQCSTDKKIFHVFPIEVVVKHMIAWWGHLWPKSHNLNKLGRGLQADPNPCYHHYTDNMDWGQHVSEISSN